VTAAAAVAAASPVARHGDGTSLAVEVTPRSARAAVEGVTADAAGAAWLAVRVTAPPDGGRANEAVLRLLAGLLAVPVSACAVAAGAGARWKRVRVAGDPTELERRATALAGDKSPEPGSRRLARSRDGD
jgi:uncharacterized protein YggU (UPF0235/DUF167 family)